MPRIRSQFTRHFLRLLPESFRYVQENRIQAWSKHLHERDFEVFGWLRGSKEFLVVDAGAHRGHSAISILSQASNAKVISFEPNVNLRPALEWVQRRYEPRFSYQLVGLGDHGKYAQLLVPQVGRWTVSTAASVRASEFDKEYVLERLKKETNSKGLVNFVPVSVEIKPLDSFGLRPHVIKIDVEGMEAEVIKGALETLRSCFPIILLELNNHMESMELLEPTGYELFEYSSAIECLIPMTESEDLPLNAFAVHPRSELRNLMPVRARTP